LAWDKLIPESSSRNPLEGPMSSHEPVPYLAVKAVMMPRDTNQMGTIFGGVLLSYIDQAGAVGAYHAVDQAGWPRRCLVTVAVNAVEFHQPVFVGDVVSFWTALKQVGTTSITIHVSVEAEREGQIVRLTEADVVFVAIGDDRRPRPIRGE
jgi:acyl-CoA thioesterase YciA